MHRITTNPATSKSLAIAQQSRSFLPGLARVLSQSGGDLRRTQKWQRIVPHRTATIFQAVADVEAYATFLPWCLKSRVLERSSNEASDTTLRTEITVGYQALKSTLNSVVEVTPMTRVHSTSEANEYVDHLSFTWDFRSVGEQTCRLDMCLDFSLRNPEQLLMWDFAHDKIISEYVRQFSKRCVTLEALERETPAS